MFKRLIKLTHGKNKDKGFSLVELLVAIILLAIIVTPMFDAFISSARINRNARKVMVATDIAQNILEGMSEKTYETLYSSVKASSVANLSATSAFTTLNGGAYNLSSNWISMTGDASLAAAFQTVTPKEVKVIVDGTEMTATTKNMISENTVTESMNAVIAKNVVTSYSMTSQKIYYCLLDSTDSSYSGEGIIYLVYTNIVDPNRKVDGTPDQDDFAYNAIVSIIPTASGIEANEYYFTYNIKVTLYSTAESYDVTAENPFGDPVLTVLGGIANK